MKSKDQAALRSVRAIKAAILLSNTMEAAEKLANDIIAKFKEMVK